MQENSSCSKKLNLLNSVCRGKLALGKASKLQIVQKVRSSFMFSTSDRQIAVLWIRIRTLFLKVAPDRFGSTRTFHNIPDPTQKPYQIKNVITFDAV